MVVISYSGREANAKIVYYGPGLGGKTTNLEFIYDSVPASSRGKMVSMKTQTDRTLFFDFLPLDLGELGGFKTRFLLYTVPGQVFYNATRKLVLRGADAVAFIADSQIGKMDENRESLANLEENLAEYDMKLDSIPWIIQYNKRDMPDIYTIEELNEELNPRNVPYFEAVATEGSGVFETFRGLSRLLLEKLSEEIGHRMVMTRTFGRKPEQEKASEIPEIKPAARVEPVCEPAKAEQPTPVFPEASEVDTEELEVLPAKTTAEPPKEETAPEIGLEPEPVAKAQPQPERAIAHEQEVLFGFFGETIQSAPLEKEIEREEVILSSDEHVRGLDDETVSAIEKQNEQMLTREDTDEPGTETEQPVERATPDEKAVEPSGEEPFFSSMVRRNNVGVFGKHEEETEQRTESDESQEHPVLDVKSLEHVIEIPASMLQGGNGREIVITLRLRLSADVENKEAPADEFMLDGISR